MSWLHVGRTIQTPRIVYILYKKEFRKMKKKSRISPWSERDENAKCRRDCLWLCQACKRGFTCRPMWRNLRQEAHSYPQADMCSAHPHCHDDTHTHTHTPINRLWSPLAYGLGGNKFKAVTRALRASKLRVTWFPLTTGGEKNGGGWPNKIMRNSSMEAWLMHHGGGGTLIFKYNGLFSNSFFF